MENEKENLLIGCACIVFDWMSKKKAKTPNSSEKRQSKQKQSSYKKDNKSILQKLKKKVTTRTLVFPKDDKGTQQTQIVTYGEHL